MGPPSAHRVQPDGAPLGLSGQQPVIPLASGSTAGMPASGSVHTQNLPLKLPTKEQMAKKRNFSDIVDLTLLDGDGDRPSANQHLDPLNKDKEVASQTNGSAFKRIEGSSGLFSSSFRLNQTRAEKDPTIPDLHNLNRFKFTGQRVNSPLEALRTAKVVDNLNGKLNSYKRRKLNVKTLARDILISKGDHDTEAPLNWHLKDLLTEFKAVSATSDLSTFRWDLVDPGGPSFESIISEHINKVDDADDESNEPVGTTNSMSPSKQSVQNRQPVQAGVGESSKSERTAT
jgi:hypothetical protein